eukprot:COSAG05_NODE_14600_length_392_cov_1.064846_1_plen_44_part_10
MWSAAAPLLLLLLLLLLQAPAAGGQPAGCADERTCLPDDLRQDP